MTNNSICRFNFSSSNDLVCSVFVLERTDAQAHFITNQEHALNLVVKGEGVLTVENKEYNLNPGTIFFVGQGERSCIKRAEMDYAYIRFRGRRANEYVQRFDLQGANRILTVNEEITKFWMECLEKISQNNIDLFNEAVLLYTLGHINSMIKAEDDTISKIIRFLGENFTNSNMSLKMVAKTIGYHEKYISTIFRKQKQITFSEYLVQLRISHAKFLMEQGIVSIKNVAILCGFSDPAYFSKAFKKHEGKSPKQYLQDIECLRQNNS